MSNICSDRYINECPTSYYMDCIAYNRGMNCWEMAGKAPCCAVNDLALCKECIIYKIADSIGIIDDEYLPAITA